MYLILNPFSVSLVAVRRSPTFFRVFAMDKRTFFVSLPVNFVNQPRTSYAFHGARPLFTLRWLAESNADFPNVPAGFRYDCFAR